MNVCSYANKSFCKGNYCQKGQLALMPLCVKLANCQVICGKDQTKVIRLPGHLLSINSQSPLGQITPGALLRHEAVY